MVGVSDVSKTNGALIDRARFLAYGLHSSGDSADANLVNRLADALEAATRERAAATAAIERVRALETFSITDSYPAWTAVDHDDLLAALDGAPVIDESLPNHCQSCGAWGTVEVHLRGCSLDGAPEPEVKP